MLRFLKYFCEKLKMFRRKLAKIAENLKCFAENWQKSRKIAIITSVPVSCLSLSNS
jgi:hypothetical protein